MESEHSVFSSLSDFHFFVFYHYYYYFLIFYFLLCFNILLGQNQSGRHEDCEEVYVGNAGCTGGLRQSNTLGYMHANAGTDAAARKGLNFLTKGYHWV